MSLHKELTDFTIGSLTLRTPATVQPGTPLSAAVAQMRDQQLGCAVLVNDQRQPVGIFTEQTLLKALVNGTPLDSATVDDFQDAAFFTVSTEAPVAEIWNAVVADGIRFVCVTGENGELLGLTGQRGLAEHISECCPQEVMVQRLGSKSVMHEREGA
jgi:CBS domain-containing protein